jgi:hypothetical protein
MSDDASYQAGRLIQWGLQPHARPAHDDEYRRLLSRFQRERAFEELVLETSRGLGMVILNADDHGLMLAPIEGSVFGTRPSEFRPGARGDTRLLDGLVQLAIATTIFPRRETLEEDNTHVRRETTVDDVEQTMRSLCARLAEEAKNKPDPTSSEEEESLIAAWRVYDRTMSVRDTGDTRAGMNSTRRIVENHLDKLVEADCFHKDDKAEPAQYQPTLRYHILVKELAATRAFEHAQRLTEGV